MHTGRACLWDKITGEMRVLASLAPLFALALLLAWLLSSERVHSLFQSPTSPPPPTEEAPLPTETSTPVEIVPTPTSPPLEGSPTMHPTEEVVKLTPSPTEVAFMPAVQVAGHPTVSSAAEPSTKAGLPLWPWILLGFLSLGAIVAGVFLLRREAPTEGEERGAL